jgi:hypothetical protein
MSESEPAKPTLSFYKHVRIDGGVRTGIDIDGVSAFHLFRSAVPYDDEDPVLDWYVSIDCSGDELPAEPEPAREWFLRNAPAIRHALREVAEELRAGIDKRSNPVVRAMPGVAPGVETSVRCWALRRVRGEEIADCLRQLADDWDETVRTLPIDEGVPH